MPFDYKSECLELAERLATATMLIEQSSDVLVKLIEAEATIARLSDTLQSIASNSCCGGCQEASKVAKTALVDWTLQHD